MNVHLKNALMRAVCDFEAKRIKHPTLGRKRKINTAQLLDHMMYVCRSGCQWKELPVTNVSHKTVYHYFALWSKARLFENVFDQMARGVASISHGALVVDTTFIKNVFGTDVLGPNPTDRGRKACKISLLTTANGTPVCSVLHRGNKHDSLTLTHTLETFERKVGHYDQFSSLLADKGYDASHCRSACRARNLIPCIPQRGTKDSYTQRYVVEQTFGLLDQFRRIRVRIEQLARNFKSFHFFALSAIVSRRLY